MNSHPFPTRFLAILMALSLCAPELYAPPQKGPNPGPHHVFAPYFRVGQGYKSTILVRNRHLKAPATVTPIVHTDQGDDLRLPPVQLAANATRAISIEDELRTAGKWVDSGALTLEYVAANPSVVNAQLTVKNAALGIIFDLPFQPGVSKKSPKPSATLTAPFWFREDHMSARLVLLNTTDAPETVNPTVLVNGQAHASQNLSLGPHQFLDMDLRQIVGAAATQGMLSLTHSGSAGAIYPALLFSNEQNGYSLTTRFTWPMAMDQSSPEANPETKPVASYHLPGVMINTQDPKLGFRKDLRFTPYALLGNTTTQPLAITLKASFDAMDGTGLQHVDLPFVSLAPLETRLLDFSQFTKSGLLPTSIMDFTLQMSHPGMMGDAVYQVFSLDQTGNFVFSAEARGNPSFRNDFVYWSTEGNNDTMLSIENVSNEDVAVRVTIGFNDGAGTYRFVPVTIPRKATVGLDLKQLIVQAAQPDDKGNKIPAGATFGSLHVETADEQLNERIMVTVSIYDPVAGTCGGGCAICNGINSFDLAANPLAGAVSTSQQVTAIITWDDLSTTDATLNTTFTSSNTSAISVTSTPGTSGNGMAAFNAAGTSTISGRLFVTGEPVGEPPPECPTSCPRTILTGPRPGITQVPTALDVLSDTGVISMSYSDCSQNVYGIAIAVHYQVLDQNNIPILSASMEPQEEFLNLVVNGSNEGNPIPNWQFVGPSSYPGTSQSTDANGQYWDAPISACVNVPFTATESQPISILLSGTRYTVRTNNWNFQSSSSGHGSITNNNDVSLSR